MTDRVGPEGPTRSASAGRHHFHGAPVVATRAPIATAALTAITFIRILITPAFLLSMWGSPLSWRGDGCNDGKRRRRAHNRAEVRDSANHQMICSFRVCGPRRGWGNRGGGSARAECKYIARCGDFVTQDLVIARATVSGCGREGPALGSVESLGAKRERGARASRGRAGQQRGDVGDDDDNGGDDADRGGRQRVLGADTDRS